MGCIAAANSISKACLRGDLATKVREVKRSWSGDCFWSSTSGCMVDILPQQQQLFPCTGNLLHMGKMRTLDPCSHSSQRSMDAVHGVRRCTCSSLHPWRPVASTVLVFWPNLLTYDLLPVLSNCSRGMVSSWYLQKERWMQPEAPW
jgi:hypothetical protein